MFLNETSVSTDMIRHYGRAFGDACYNFADKIQTGSTCQLIDLISDCLIFAGT
ncbi:hypothetical protein [Methylobacter sp. BlB1]|uniref:hypothetical protein n=1 Tax=Methylobacter sp. BlB1 TaxID=2785914 RepID=UPI001E292D3F|nr:hypothetical protein [Methylobacter sp. BlB1]